jgi:hypothetical protein
MFPFVKVCEVLSIDAAANVETGEEQRRCTYAAMAVRAAERTTPTTAMCAIRCVVVKGLPMS